MEVNEKQSCLTDQLDTVNKPDNYIRVALVGNVDSGKSTLVGVLTKNILDDGRGSSREKVFNYAHEQKTGRTSSIAQEIMGFDENMQQIIPDRFSQKKNKYWVEVLKKTKKLIQIIDLCGHEKYLKTTMLGLNGLVPDYVLIVVGANLGLSRMTKEHLGIVLALEIPFFVVITKTDMVEPSMLKTTVDQIQKLLKHNMVGKKPFVINKSKIEKIDKEDINKNEKRTLKIQELKDNENEVIIKSIDMIKSNVIVPIFQVSSVSGDGFNHLLKFFSCLKSRNTEIPMLKTISDPLEFHILEHFNVPGVGLIISGLIFSGTIKENEQYLLGPDEKNSYKQVIVKSLHFNRVKVDKCYSGYFCTAALKSVKKKEQIGHDMLRKGTVLLDQNAILKPVWKFDAEIAVLHHSTTITKGYECVMQCGVIRQTVRIIGMTKEVLKNGDKDRLTFRFIFHSEFLKPNSKFLLREGRTKILGEVTKVYSTLEDNEQLIIFKQIFINFILQ